MIEKIKSVFAEQAQNIKVQFIKMVKRFIDETFTVLKNVLVWGQTTGSGDASARSYANQIRTIESSQGGGWVALSKANEAQLKLSEKIDMFGFATIADLNKLIGKRSSLTDYKYGVRRVEDIQIRAHDTKDLWTVDMLNPVQVSS